MRHHGNRVRTFSICIALASFLLAIAPAAAVEPGDVTVSLEPVADGLTAPVVATHAGDGSGRLFVVDQAGLIRIVDADGVLLPTPFLDLTDEIVELNPFFDERGLLGLAFHPDYEDNGRFFVRYSAPREGREGEPCFGSSRGCHAEVLAEYRVSEDDPNVAVPEGEVLLSVDEPQFNHDSGHVAFGPDGLLYFTLGDGGGAHDGLADEPPSHGPIGNGQNIETVLGSMLRIDVDGQPAEDRAYAIPDDNPFAGRRGADEIFAYGFRNPYRFSFDPVTGLLIAADVGQNLFEEVDIVQKGGNYGWVTREGYACFDPFNPTVPPESCPDTGPLGEPLLDPIAAYDHDEGIAIVGGHVYRGDDLPALEGKYVFGDFSQGFFPPAGRLFYLDFASLTGEGTSVQAAGSMPSSDGLVVPNEPVRLPIFELQRPDGGGPLGQYLLGFGQDGDGELYVLTSESTGPSGATGQVWRIAPAEGSE
jgi:glucose/arabinose dehydrogenase